MSWLRLIFRNLSGRPGLTLASVAGAAVGMAIIIGSLVVGDSVRGTLGERALRRLGPVSQVVVGDGLLDSGLAGRVSQSADLQQRGLGAAPVIIMPATAMAASAATAGGDGDGGGGAGGNVTRPVTLLGVDADFWRLAWQGGAAEATGSTAGPRGSSAWISRGLARAAGLAEGDDIVLTVPGATQASADTVFGNRHGTMRRLRVTVRRLLDDGAGAGAFSLDPLAEADMGNVLLDLDWLGRQTGLDGRANVLLVGELAGGRDQPGDGAADGGALLRDALVHGATLADYGLRLVEREAAEAAENRSGRLLAVEATSVVLDPRQVQAVRGAMDAMGLPSSAVSAYLMNTVRLEGSEAAAGSVAGRDEVPYVMLAGVDFSSPLIRLSPLRSGDELPVPAEGEALVNSHLAKELGLSPGERLQVRFYQVQADGELGEVSRQLPVVGLVDMTGSGADAMLVPQVEGLTSSEEMRSWDPPFPVDQRLINDRDEAYWDTYRAAPRILVSQETAHSIWRQALTPASAAGGGRHVTGVLTELPADVETGQLAADLAAALPAAGLGLAVREVRQEALAAAAGSSDYSALFAGLGMFLVAAAAVLVALLGRLSVERRAGQVGLLLAVGFSRGQCACLLLGESAALALLAALVAAPMGVGYAVGLLAGLNLLWPQALAGVRLELHFSWVSLAAGMAVGGLAAAGAMLWGLSGLRGRGVLELLSGWRSISAGSAATADGQSGRGGGWAIIGGLTALLAGAILVALSVAGLVSAVAAFFAGGLALLLGGLLLAWWRLSAPGGASTGPDGRLRWSLGRLAWQSAARNRLRSMLTIALVAAASFTITGVAANRRDAGGAAAALASGELPAGAGGLELKIETQLPLPVPLDAHLRRQGAGNGRSEAGRDSVLRGARVYSLRVSGGDDISCLNVARPMSPRVVGLGAALRDRGGFHLAAAVGGAAAGADDNPMRLLDWSPDDEAVPVLGDEASLRWILGRELGETFEIDGPGGPVRVRIVGMLRGSIWQRELLMAEEAFVAAFGADGGYGLFVADVPAKRVAAAGQELSSRLADYGPRVTETADLLAAFASVQNAYLATFQTLGGLGLGLGLLGLVTVMLRGAEERRHELALMQAVGFRRADLVRLLTGESGILMTVGLAIGAFAAVAAVLPVLLESPGAAPWGGVALMLGGIWLFGIVCCAIAARHVSRADLLGGLRRE